MGVIGAVAAVAAVGFMTSKGGAKANPCPCEARNPRRGGLNNTEREQWIDNDEGLYSWWRSSRMSKRDFIKEARFTRQMVGGGMRQGGIMAAAGIVAFEKMIDRLEEEWSRWQER